MADSVETLGVVLGTGVKRLGAKEKNEKQEVQSEILAHKEEQSFSQELHAGGVKKLLRTGVAPARAWAAQAVGIAPTEILKLRRQMAAAAV